MEDAYNYDKEFNDHKYVITGACAFARLGLVHGNPYHLDLQTAFPELDNLNTIIFAYHYNPNIDFSYQLCPSSTNNLLLLPSRERAIVEVLLHLDWCDEGILIEALRSYIDQFWNEEKLFAVADYFGLSREILNYWLEEARNAEDD